MSESESRSTSFDFRSSFHDVLKQRIFNPFLVVYAGSFLVTNFGMVLTLLGEKPTSEKIVLMSQYLSFSWGWSGSIRTFAAPLGGVLAYFVFVPILTAGALLLSELAKNIYAALTSWARQMRFVTREEKVIMLAEQRDQILRHRTEKDSLLAEISQIHGKTAQERQKSRMIIRRAAASILSFKSFSWGLDGPFDHDFGRFNPPTPFPECGFPSVWRQKLEELPYDAITLREFARRLDLDEEGFAPIAMDALGLIELTQQDLTVMVSVTMNFRNSVMSKNAAR